MISRLYLLGTAVLGAMLNTFLPEIVKVSHHASRLHAQFRIFLFANLALGVTGWACFYGLGARLSELLAHRSLPDVHAIAPIFALVFLLMAMANPFLSMLPTLHRGTEYMAGIASALLLVLGLDLTLMPRYGVVGAAYAQDCGDRFSGDFQRGGIPAACSRSCRVRGSSGSTRCHR